MYTSGDDHALKAPCTQIMALVAEGKLEAVTTPEAIQEFAHVFARRRGRRAAFERATAYATLLAPLRVSQPGHLEVGLQIWSDNEHLGAFDAVLAAIALDTNYQTLVSADRAFDSIPGLNVVYPDATGVASLVEP